MKKTSSVKKIALVAAAGNSSRMKTGESKQFLMLSAYPVLAVTLLKLSMSDYIDEIIVVTREADIVTVGKIISEYNIKKVSLIIPGGKTRQESVYKGLKEIPDDALVFIHDGARPFFSESLLSDLTEKALEYDASAPGIVPKDTIAVIDKDGFFKEITKRDFLRGLQTPQVFKAKAIKASHIRAYEESKEFTDDCSLFTYYGGNVYITEGEETNIKITVPEDIPIAQLIMEDNGI